MAPISISGSVVESDGKFQPLSGLNMKLDVMLFVQDKINTLYYLEKVPVKTKKYLSDFRAGVWLSNTTLAHHRQGPGFDSKHCKNIIKVSG